MHSEEAVAPAVRRPSVNRPSLERLPPIMTVDSVSRALRVDRKTIYEMVRAKTIPGVVRLGRVIRFSRDALLVWLGVRKG